jgi:hypothetical protein
LVEAEEEEEEKEEEKEENEVEAEAAVNDTCSAEYAGPGKEAHRET